jgi:hypothetical protein
LIRQTLIRQTLIRQVMIRQVMTRRLLLLPLAAAIALQASTPAAWELSSFTDFIKGTFDGVSLGRDGHLAVAPALNPLFVSGQQAIWALAPAPGGVIYAGTGHLGRVFRIDPSGASSLIWTADRPEVFALAIDSRGVLYAGASPNGKIWRIENGRATEYFDPKAKYIWALAFGADGALYAGTGDEGRIFRITGVGQGDEYYATGQAHVTGLMLDRNGALLAGTEPNGILYRITAQNQAFALYDSPLPEIRAIATGPDGSVYAAGLGGALAKKVQSVPQNQTAAPDTPTFSTSITVTAQAGGSEIKPAAPDLKAPAPTPAATTATTTEVAGVERSAIYKINSDNTVDTLWTSKEENVFDILAEPDGLIRFATDVNGRVYQLTPDRKLTLLAETREQEAMRLLHSGSATLVATANVGKIYKLDAPGAKGTWESAVFDASAVARWGKVRWNATGTTSLTIRSGNSLRPDNTWSAWSAPLTDSQGSQIPSPNARFLQIRASLTGPNATIDGIVAAYLPQNNPPVIHSITVVTQASASTAKAAGANPSSAATAPFSITVTDTGDAGPTISTGTPTQTLSRIGPQQMVISWQADDPDGDRLVYDVDVRGEGESAWKTLRRELHENTWTIDGDSLADGRYYFRVHASDREVNPPPTARDAELVSSPVLVDNTPPVVRVTASSRSEVVFDAFDSASPLRRAEWSIDGGPWTPIAPVDGVLDSQSEQFRLPLTLSPGEHTLLIRAADAGGNTSLAKVVLR